jgi:cytochrome c
MCSTNSLRRTALALSFVAFGLLGAIPGADAQGYGGPYPFGRPATPEEITRFDIDVMADGTGLPAGQGTAAAGETVYKTNCALCHGDNLMGGDATKVKFDRFTPRGDQLIGGRGTLTTNTPVKTVESYWPYATTLYDYIRRAMPFTAPGSLTDAEVYAVTAYILSEAKIIDKAQVMNKDTLWKVQMPNRNGFIPDPRPDKVINYD